jgi:hypothetical protein
MEHGNELIGNHNGMVFHKFVAIFVAMPKIGILYNNINNI